MERRKFTREFKLEAVRLIKDRRVSYVQAARDVGVHVSQLRDLVPGAIRTLLSRIAPVRGLVTLRQTFILRRH
jgi:transposase-like protein